MTFDEELLVNRLAQRIIPAAQGEAWFLGLDGERRLATLRALVVLMLEARAETADVPSAAAWSGLGRTATVVQMLSTGDLRDRAAKIGRLPKRSWSDAFRLLVGLLAVADERRRARYAKSCAHWWHGDISSAADIAATQRNRVEATGVERFALGDGPTGVRGHVELSVRIVEQGSAARVSWVAPTPEEPEIVELLRGFVEGYVVPDGRGLDVEVTLVGRDPVCRNDNVRAANLALQSALETLGLPPLPLYADPRSDSSMSDES